MHGSVCKLISEYDKIVTRGEIGDNRTDWRLTQLMSVSSNIMGGGYPGLTQSSLVCGCIHPMLPPSGGLHPPRAPPNHGQHLKHPPRASLLHNFSHNELKITSHFFCFFLFFFLSFPSPSSVSSTDLIHVEPRATIAYEYSNTYFLVEIT